MKINSYKELIVWQRAIELTIEVYRATREYPKEEIYGLTSQTRRAAVSIPANISEGWSRQHTPEYLQFLHIALGSASELETHFIIARSLKFIADPSFNAIIALNAEVTKMLNTIIRNIRINQSKL